MKFNRALSIAAGTLTLASLGVLLPAQATLLAQGQGNVGDAIIDEAVPERPATPTTPETLQRTQGTQGQGQGAGAGGVGGTQQQQQHQHLEPGARPGDVGDAVVDEAVPEQPATPTTPETLRPGVQGQGQGQGAGGQQMQPGMQQPGMVQPGMQQQPGMMQPGMQQPGMMQPGGQGGAGFGTGFGGTFEREAGRLGTRSAEHGEIGINETFVNFNYGRGDANNFPRAVGDTFKDKMGPELTNVYRLQNQ